MENNKTKENAILPWNMTENANKEKHQDFWILHSTNIIIEENLFWQGKRTNNKIFEGINMLIIP